MTQPEALRLADALEATDQMHANADLTSAEVAAELRRLHAYCRDLESHDGVTIDLLNERVAYLEAQAAPAECHHRPPCAECVVAELAEKLRNPLVFQWDSGVADVALAAPQPEAQAVSKPTRTVTYVCPVCDAGLERQE
jgi:hypothetical protein